ncbi:hypothetical protein JTB14_007601 [Gonioctena quinquepunctata]|nr:hypothetical protein JTB14_007601 [Gonioctena quinquepunctata]
MEHELRNAVIYFAGEQEQSNDQSLPRSELEGKIENVYPSMAEWVSRIVPVPLPKESNPEVLEQLRNEIQLLCETMSNVVKTIAPSGQDKLLTRYIVDKDFPMFDGEE